MKPWKWLPTFRINLLTLAKAYKTSHWHSAQENDVHLKIYTLIMKKKSYKQLDFKHYMDKTKAKYGTHIRIRLRVFERKFLRNT
jgi:hypothetical protein